MVMNSLEFVSYYDFTTTLNVIICSKFDTKFYFLPILYLTLIIICRDIMRQETVNYIFRDYFKVCGICFSCATHQCALYGFINVDHRWWCLMFLFHVIISPQGSIIETIKYSSSPPFCVWMDISETGLVY